MSSIRRSQRVPLKIPIVVSGEGRGRIPFYQETRTVLANAHGALLLLRAKVIIGQVLTLTNVRTQMQRSCRVVSASATQSSHAEIGVEFLRPCPSFWNISSPPPDWNCCEEAARAAATA